MTEVYIKVAEKNTKCWFIATEKQLKISGYDTENLEYTSKITVEKSIFQHLISTIYRREYGKNT